MCFLFRPSLLINIVVFYSCFTVIPFITPNVCHCPNPWVSIVLSLPFHSTAIQLLVSKSSNSHLCAFHHHAQKNSTEIVLYPQTLLRVRPSHACPTCPPDRSQYLVLICSEGGQGEVRGACDLATYGFRGTYPPSRPCWNPWGATCGFGTASLFGWIRRVAGSVGRISHQGSKPWQLGGAASPLLVRAHPRRPQLLASSLHCMAWCRGRAVRGLVCRRRLHLRNTRPQRGQTSRLPLGRPHLAGV